MILKEIYKKSLMPEYLFFHNIQIIATESYKDYKSLLIDSPYSLGYLDVKLTLVFVKYASVMVNGILKPKKIDKKIERANSFNESDKTFKKIKQFAKKFKNNEFYFAYWFQVTF